MREGMDGPGRGRGPRNPSGRFGREAEPPADENCCGGGRVWLDSFSRDHTRLRLSDQRVIEAAETGAQALGICCP